MRNLVVTQFMSLDGVIEDPSWTFKYWNDETANFKAEETLSSDAMLLGRVTYQGFAAVWPTSKDMGAEYFNGVRKYVVSNTLDKAEWNNSKIIKGDIVAEIKKLKQEDGTNITIHGSCMLAQSMLEQGLVDRVRLLVYPVVLGKGKRLFKDGMTETFKLLEAKPFSSGVMALIYEPVKK